VSLSFAAACSQTARRPSEAIAVRDEPSAYPVPPESDEYETPPLPERVQGNSLEGLALYVDRESDAMAALEEARRAGDVETTKALERIALQPQSLWMGWWNADVYHATDAYVSRAASQHEVPVLVLYNLFRDYQASCGPFTQSDSYRGWIRKVSAGIGDRPAVVVLEPDALFGIAKKALEVSIPAGERPKRLELLRDAVLVFRQNPKVRVYLAAGHPEWLSVVEAGALLQEAGIEYAHGFSLNAAHHFTTKANLEYGRKISALTGGAHFVIDTSRNGAGPFREVKKPEDEWCNAPGRRLGDAPTVKTGEPKCDAFLWLARPGVSDGTCRGGPAAGVWWLEEALRLAVQDD